MSNPGETFHETPCKTISEAYQRASEAAVAVNGNPVPGVLYRQGNRRFISTSVPNNFLVRLIPPKASLTTAQKQAFDPENERNRPIDPAHRRAISEYLQNVEDYIIPPILLNATQALQIFPVENPSKIKPCVFVMPLGEYLYVTDGQHRVEGLRDAMKVRKELAEDAVSVTIVEEEDIGRCQQDFYDAAQVKKLSPSLLVEFDMRAPFNAVTRDLAKRVRVFQGRIQRLGTQVSKKSPMLFTNSMIKRAVCSITTGNQNNTEGAAHIIGANLPLWEDRIVAFFEAFTEANEPWGLVASRSLATGATLDAPKQREEYLHFTGAGLLILGAVAYAIFAQHPTASAALTPAQQTLIERLGREIDWHRSNPLWKRSVIGFEGTIQPHMGVLQIAIYDVKRAIGIDLDEQDAKDLAKLEERKRQREEKRVAELRALEAEEVPA